MQHFSYNFKALGCSNSLQFYCADSKVAREFSNKIIDDVNTVEKKYSRYLADSIVSKINSSAGSNNSIKVDPETAALLDYAAICYEQSDGLFDITSGILNKAWNFSEPILPSESQISELLELVGWDKVEWKNPYFRLTKAGMQIDFGGFGKEYAADRAANLAFQLGIKNGFINLGGDIRVLGPHLDGKAWHIGISHPRKKDSAICSVAMDSGAIASSGDYERYIEINGKRYCHIINPKSGRPAEELQAVSVFSDSCLIAGSAATISMLLGEIKAKEFLNDLGLKSILIDAKGKLINLLNEQYQIV